MAERDGAGAKKDATVNVGNSLSSRLNNPASFGMPGRRRAQKGRSLNPHGKSSSAPAMGWYQQIWEKKYHLREKYRITSLTQVGAEKGPKTQLLSWRKTLPPPSHHSTNKKTKQRNKKSTLRAAKVRLLTGNFATGENIDAYLLLRVAETGSGNAAEFLNGNFLYMRPTKDAQSVYDLGVVDHSEVDMDDYHTMSRAGITHFTLSSEPEFTPLDVWEREYHLFNVIQFIPFFRKYRLWKSYTTWKKTVSIISAFLSSFNLMTDKTYKYYCNPGARR